MSNIKERKKTPRDMMKEDLKHFGSTSIFEFMKESIEEMEKWVKDMEDKLDVFHIRLTDLDSFEKSIEEFAEKHPDHEIEATGFVFSSKKPVKSKRWSFRKKE